VRSLLGLFSIITGELNKYQEGIVGDVLISIYENSGSKEVTMGDFARELERRMKKARDEQLRHDMQFLLISIRPFLKGNIYGFVDRKTTIEIDPQLHVFDLSEYKNDRTLKDFFNYLIFDFISNRLLTDRRPKALFMDEGWTMVKYKGSEDYVRYIIKDSRKYNVSFVFITQELEDMLSSDAGRSILNNTSTQFMFHQKESAMPLMKKTLNLTEAEYEKLITVSKGEGLLISDKHRLFFRVQTSKKEHELISTDPNAKKEKIRIVSAPKQEFLSPALRSAMRDVKDIATSIGIDGKGAPDAGKRGGSPSPMREEGNEDLLAAPAGREGGSEGLLQEPVEYGAGAKKGFADGKRGERKLPIALTHNLVSGEDRLALLKPLELPKAKKGGKKKKK
jgi:hypothetical protein